MLKLENTCMQRNENLTNREKNRHPLSTRYGSLALLAVVAVLVTLGLNPRPFRVAGASTDPRALAYPQAGAVQSGKKPTPADPDGQAAAPETVKPAEPSKSGANSAPSGFIKKPAGGPTITPVAMPTPTNNDYTVINNAIQAATSGDTITLSGTFNWTEANAAASWALGSDGMASTIDDFSIYPPLNLNNITFTAASL